MTKKPERKLAHEILGLIAISGAVAAALFAVLTGLAGALVQEYIFNNSISMTEFDWMELDRWIYGVGAIISILAFSILFLALLADRMAYIRTITQGIGELDHQTKPLPLEGNNELTKLADAINTMATESRLLREKEAALAQEKAQFIRALSHDIRTPLTSILAYSEYLTTADLSEEERREQLLLIQRKALQIRDLTDLLLDGNRRNMEHFADAKLLMEQLAAEFEETLEDDFQIVVDLSACTPFSGSFDVQQLRRIFDNLSSNVQKYADPARPVTLSIALEDNALVICQENSLGPVPENAESHKLGLRSIQSIAQSYGGGVEVQAGENRFAISITIPT